MTRRRGARDRAEPAADRKRRRWISAGAFVVIVAAVATYRAWQQGRPSGPPVRELGVLADALHDRDVGAVVALWDESVDREAVRRGVARLLADLGMRGTTPRSEPPRVRRLDDYTYWANYRLGEIDVEVRWVWDGARFRVGSMDRVR